MIVAMEFDGVVVRDDDHDFDDTETPLTFLPGARAGLRSMRLAGHVLVLFSARANRSLRIDPMLDPLVFCGVTRLDVEQWRVEAPIYQSRFEQMLSFCESHLPGVFHAIDDGAQGKPLADLFIDRRAFAYRPTDGWLRIASMYGARPRPRSGVGR